MKYEDMQDKIVKDKYGYEFIGNSIMVGKNEVGCLKCGTPSRYIDVFSEAHFCSEECLKAFDEEWAEQLSNMDQPEE
ncbi:MAG: hypothetical protein ACRDD7_11940 [Peptostreptococcaceae bacterium]